jgi:mRNA-degrading endonuclease HigB of HigAB toxin-antitoxin module
LACCSCALIKRDTTLSDNRVIFNIKGNHYRLVVKAAYQAGILRIILKH